VRCNKPASKPSYRADHLIFVLALSSFDQLYFHCCSTSHVQERCPLGAKQFSTDSFFWCVPMVAVCSYSFHWCI
jgi:hypothetical protein